MKYGFSDQQLSQIKDILCQFPGIESAILFGSRAMGNYKPASDADIAIKGQGVDTLLAAKLRIFFEEETDLPYFFDVVAYDSIKSDKLKEHISRMGKIIYLKRNASELDS